MYVCRVIVIIFLTVINVCCNIIYVCSLFFKLCFIDLYVFLNVIMLCNRMMLSMCCVLSFGNMIVL